MRVRKGETSIHWHDFIAAGLSQCQVDDRNLRLAFGRLDQEHKGYITFENIMVRSLWADKTDSNLKPCFAFTLSKTQDLFGDNTFESEDQMLKMWGDSLKDVNLRLITYEDFVLLMKGQKRDTKDGRQLRSSFKALTVVPEIIGEDEADHGVQVTPLSSFNKNEFHVAPPSDKLDESAVSIPPSNSPGSKKSVPSSGSDSAPATPVQFGKRFDDFEEESPLSMDEAGESGRVTPSSSYDQVFRGELTPPQTPVRGPADYVTPNSSLRATFDPQLLSKLTPPDLSLPMSIVARGRSTSLDDNDSKHAHSRKSMMCQRDSRRTMTIPESDTAKVIEDKTKKPLVVNRALYRAHREFRHSITEASKRFEDEQMRRAKKTLQAQTSAIEQRRASLVMRRGQGMSEESIKGFLKKTLDERQKQMDKANRRGGRGRHGRKKTISDMSGMMGGPALPQATVNVTRSTEVLPLREAMSSVQENENLLRKPTKPGEFRKTNYNPFQRRCSMNMPAREFSVKEEPETRSSSANS